MKKIAIVSLFGCGNIGDEAILTSLVNSFLDLNIGMPLQSLALSPSGYAIEKYFPNDTQDNRSKKIHSIFFPSEGRRKGFIKTLLTGGEIKSLATVFLQSDIILFGGGYWLHDYTPYNLPLVLGFALFCKCFRKKIVFYAIGAGPISTFIGRLLTKYILSYTDLILVRDAFSYAALQSAGLKKMIFITADPALLLKPISADKSIGSSALLQFINNDRNTIGFSVSAWLEIKNLWKYRLQDFVEPYKGIAKLLDIIVRTHGVQILFIPTMLPEDLEACRKIAEYMTEVHSFVLTGSYYPAQIQDIIGQVSCFVSMRLHPLIFAVIQSCPVIAISYDPKVASFMSDIGQGAWCLKMDEMHKLPTLVSKLLKRQNDQLEEIGSRMEALKNAAANNIKLLNENLLQ